MARFLSLFLTTAILSMAFAVPATQLSSAQRQVGFEFDASAADPTLAALTPIEETTTETETEATPVLAIEPTPTEPATTATEVEVEPATDMAPSAVTTITEVDTEPVPDMTPTAVTTITEFEIEPAADMTPTAVPATTELETEPVPDMTPAAEAGDSTTTTATVEEPESMTGPFAFAYNVGGGASGDFAADPEDYVIGDTLTFDLPESNIVANTTTNPYKAIYESHRHGHEGATWGYDIPVATPGTYQCTLHYAETYDAFFTEESNREFKVMIAGDGVGTRVQDATFDVMIELEGAEFTPYTSTFSNLMVATKIMIREQPISGTGDAFLSGISCVQTS